MSHSIKINGNPVESTVLSLPDPAVELERLRKENDDLKKMLAGFEWSGQPQALPTCPVCQAPNTAPRGVGRRPAHAPKCLIGKLLGREAE